MPRLHTLFIPGPDSRFAFILDQATENDVRAANAWRAFALNCGAADLIVTTETVDIDPDREISDGWQPDDDEPVDYAPADPRCGPRVITPLDLVSMVQAAHAAAWEPWAPANLDPESPRISTHPAESCAAVNNEALGCPMHAPILGGPWDSWPFFASNPADIGPTITRICEHGITHPTPEEYVGGFDIPHLCDGCPCADEEVRIQFAIVVSDLANTRLPRGTLLLGVKDEPAISPEWVDRLAQQNRDASGRWVPDDPTPVTAPPASGGWISPPPQCTKANEGGRCLKPDSHDGECAFPPDLVFVDTPVSMPDLAAENWGTARIRPLGPDGEPVGEARDYPLAGPVTITEKAYVDPAEKTWTSPLTPIEAVAATIENVKAQSRMVAADAPVEVTEDSLDLPTLHVGRSQPGENGWAAPPEKCVAGGEASRCTLPYGHEGLHEFGPFTRV